MTRRDWVLTLSIAVFLIAVTFITRSPWAFFGYFIGFYFAIYLSMTHGNRQP